MLFILVFQSYLKFVMLFLLLGNNRLESLQVLPDMMRRINERVVQYIQENAETTAVNGETRLIKEMDALHTLELCGVTQRTVGH